MFLKFNLCYPFSHILNIFTISFYQMPIHTQKTSLIGKYISTSLSTNHKRSVTSILVQKLLDHSFLSVFEQFFLIFDKIFFFICEVAPTWILVDEGIVGFPSFMTC